jgi:hypothetical protein
MSDTTIDILREAAEYSETKRAVIDISVRSYGIMIEAKGPTLLVKNYLFGWHEFDSPTAVDHLKSLINVLAHKVDGD